MDSQLTIKFVPLKNSHYNMVVLIIHLYLILEEVGGGIYMYMYKMPSLN